MSDIPANYLIHIYGRGAAYCCLAQNVEYEDLVERCQRSVDCGFEVYIYSITPSPVGNQGFIPDGCVSLKRHAHLYDATDEFNDKVESIINHLSVHSVEASRKYITLMQERLAKEQDALTNTNAPPTTGS